MADDGSLIARKQRRARQRIIDAADELFASRGFESVSVSDIAERAEVGRTSFFRLFGDKQEVVFAREQEVLALVTAADIPSPGADPGDLFGALRAVQPVILRVTAQMAADADGLRRHMRLVESHTELRERDAAKLQVIVGELGGLLEARGWDAFVSVLSAQIAVACFWTARRTTADPKGLLEATRRAFEETLTVGAPRT